LLGSDQQAKGAMYYITPYLGKSKNRLLQSLGILRSSLYHTDNFQSVHPDAELETEDGIKKNPVRSVKRVLQRFVNQSNLHLELSDYQIAASLLDIPNIITTDQYSYLDPDAHMAYRTFVQMEEDARWLEDKIFSYINGVTESETPVNCTENPVIADNFVPVRRVYDLEDIKKGIGYLRTMPFPVGEDKKKLRKLVPVSSFYANRGYDLRNINLVEYCTIIDVKEIKGFSATRNKHFSFSDRFFCAANHDQALRSKQRTVLVIRKPPPHPGDRPLLQPSKGYDRWRKQADDYARFYLTLYRPEVDCYSAEQHNDYLYTWEALESFVYSLSSDDTILSKFRLMSMHTRMKGLYTSYKNKIILGTYRALGRDLWDEETKQRIAIAKSLNNIPLKKRNVSGMSNVDEKADLSLMENINIRKVLTAASDLARTCNDFKVSKSLVNNINIDGEYRPVHNPLCNRDIGLIQKFGLNLRDITSDQINHNYSKSSDSFDDRQQIIQEHRYWISRFKKRQREVYNVYREYLKNPFNPSMTKPPSITWLNGGAGYGKSELLRQIIVYCELKGRKCVRTAFNHINALHINGTTSWSMLHFSDKDMERHMNFASAKWWKEFTDLVNDAVLIVIDEFSNQAPWHLAKFSKACQALTGKYNLPFGGIPVIMCGDLGQIGPVRAGKSLASAIIDMCLNVWTIPYAMMNPNY
jgi:hypothetical protein